MEQHYNAAVIGCGRMGAFTSDSVVRNVPPFWLPLSHAEAIQAHPRLRLNALCDTHPQTLERASAVYPQARTYATPADLLETERPDLVGLATRTLGRAELILAAIAAGTRAIHAEKPLCNSMAELDALTAALSPADAPIFVTWGAIRRFLPVYRQALALASSGRWGRLREVRVSMGFAPLFWTHPHSIDLVLFAAGGRRVVGIQAMLRNVVQGDRPSLVESDPKVAVASIHFDDGLVGLIGQALGSDFTLSCEQGEISVESDGKRLRVYAAGDGPYPDSSELAIDPSPLPGGSLAPISHLVQCLQGDADSIATNAALCRDILTAQRISFAMMQSHLEGSRLVDLQAIDPALCILAMTDGRYA